MQEAIWATWYDLDEDGREPMLAWLHATYLPLLTALPQHRWVAHYRNVGPGPALATYHDVAGHAAASENIPVGSQYVILVGAASSHAFFNPYFGAHVWPAEVTERLRALKHVRTAILAEEARATGPAWRERASGDGPAPAIQFGTYRIRSVEDELDLSCWYAQQRFPVMSRMPGAVLTRKFLTTAGWAKHGILYEFESLEARTREFEEPHESKVVDVQEWTGRIVRTTLHTPGSPVVGERLWP